MTEPMPIPPIPPPPADAPRRGVPGMSIAHRLPLLMTAVVIAVVAACLVLTYRALGATERAGAATRLREAAMMLASTADANSRQRAVQIARALHDSTVLAAVRRAGAPRGPSAADSATLARALRRVEMRGDSGLPIAVWAADGRPLATVGAAPAPAREARPDLAAIPAPGDVRRPADSAHVGRPFIAGGRIYYHFVAPIDTDGERLGYFVALRRFANNPRLAAQLRGLTGEEVALYLHQNGSPIWASLDGTPAQAPRETGEDRVVARPGVGALLTAHAKVPGLPWTVTLEEPLAAVLRRPRAVLLELAAIGALLTLAGAAAAWAIGRRVARPIASLTAAAEAVARGDYRSRVDERGDDEVARLARSFNRMAHDVDASQRERERQYLEARNVARELEEANRRLHAAVHAVEEARDAAEQANRAKSDFLAVMSHELRTPLNAIGGYAELMQLGIYGSVTDEQARALSRVTRSQQHLLGLINDVLNFAKLNAAKVHFDIHDVPMNHALAAVEPMVAPQLVAKKLRYACASCAPTLTVRADRDKLQQILLNLLSNAVKFTPEDGTVTVDCTVDDTAVRVSVRDTGVGIPPDRLRHVFEPFVQVDRALNRPHEGVGLGLAISHDLALGMNGTLVAESTPGDGSTFTLVLPRGMDAPRPAVTEEHGIPLGVAEDAPGR